MLLPATPALALRVGWCAGDAAQDPDVPARGACLAELPYEGADNPWHLDACLVLAEPIPGEVSPSGELIDRVSSWLRRGPPGGGEISELLPEALAAAHTQAREPSVGVLARFRLSLACVRRGRCWAAQAPGLPAYILREGALRPLRAEARYHVAAADEGDLEPEIARAELQDGDALLLCSQSIHEILSDREVHDLLVHAANPEVAARKLVRESLLRGAHAPAACVLFAGVGPAVAHRLLRSSRVAPAPAGSEYRQAQRSGPPLALVAALTGLAGALLGVSAGVLISGSASRPAPAEMSVAPVLDGAATPIVPSPTLTPMVPTPPSPAVAQSATVTTAPDGTPGASGTLSSTNPTPASATAAPAASSPSDSAPTAPEAAAAATVTPGTPAIPVVLDQEPPRHTLAPGLAGGIQLTLRADLSSGTLGLRLNQGVMFTSGTPQGTPVGETLAVPLHDLQRGQPTGRAELRLLSPGHPPVSVSGEDVSRLLQGQVVTVPGLRPGTYDLSWWDARSTTGGPSFLSLRIQGL